MFSRIFRRRLSAAEFAEQPSAEQPADGGKSRKLCKRSYNVNLLSEIFVVVFMHRFLPFRSAFVVVVIIFKVGVIW